MHRITLLVTVLVAAMGTSALAVDVPLEAFGVVLANSLTFGPLAGVPAGSDAHMIFAVDSENYIDVDPGHDRAYFILNDTYVLTAGDATLENITGEHYIHITNDYWVVDGVHWFEENIGYGYWQEFELWGNNDEMFPSTDITECAGEYGRALFADTSWGINWAFIVRFDLLVIHDVSGAVESPGEAQAPVLLSAAPNPSRGELSILYTAPAAGTGNILILDAAGRRVQSFVVTASEGVVRWNGTGDSGRPVSPGAYFIRLQAGGQTETRQVLLIR